MKRKNAKKRTLEHQKMISVSLRFSPIQYVDFRKKVEKSGLTASEFIRKSVKKCIVKKRVSPDEMIVILKLVGMSNNLNQLTKKANAAGFYTAKKELEILRTKISEIIKLLRNDSKN